MPEDARARKLWNYKTGDQVRCVAISSDGQFVVTGGKDGHVYFFNRAGQLLWRGNVGGDVFRLALAEGHRRVLIGSISSGIQKAHLWNYEGHLLQTYQTDGVIPGVGITPNADLVALGTTDRSLYLFDGIGNLLWQHQVGGPIRRISITPDGQYIALGSDDQHVYLFDQDGNECWRFKTGALVFTGAQIDATAEYIAAGSNDYHLYLLDRNGQPIWKYNTQANVNITVLTPDGRYVAAAGNAHTVFLFNNAGELLWSYAASADIYGLAISVDGQFVVAGTNDNQVYLFDKEGHCIWREKTRREVSAVAITPNGRLFAAASLDHSIYVYENLAAPEDFSKTWFVRTIVSRIRQTYAINSHQGVASWFDEFDRALRQREFAICHDLLREVRKQGYVLSAEEHAYVDSREGALLLCQGISYHQRGEYEKARQAYEQSLQIQHNLGHKAGEGQANIALEELDKQQRGDAGVLRQLASKPRVLGNSHELLSERITHLPAADQLQVILAAKNSGYLSPLTTALLSDEPSIQANAATALSWLKPGPGYGTLIDMLASPNWVVRWQATLMLQQRANERQGEFAQYRDSVREAVAGCLADGELDPTVRRVMARLLGKIGDTSDTPQLATLLDDKDADVRLAVAEVLAQIGDRQALPALRRVEDGKDFEGNPVQNKAAEAIKQIEDRYPIFEVKKVALCREVTEKKQPVQPATVFLTYAGPLHCVVTVSLPKPDTRVTCYWREKGRTAAQQELVIANSQQSPTPLVEILSSSTGQQAEQEQADLSKSTSVVFSWTPPRGRWMSGNYSVQVALNEVIQQEQSFTVIDEVRILEAKTCLAIESDGPHLIELPIFPATIPNIYCAVTLNDAPSGLEVQGVVERKDTNMSVTSNKVTTESEGRLVKVILAYESARWEVGEYRIVLRTATGHRTSCDFRIIPLELFTEN